MHDRPGTRGMLHCGTTANPAFRSCRGPIRTAIQQKAKFFGLIDRQTQNSESEQPFEALSWRSLVWIYPCGSACALEGLFEALARFLSHVPGCHRCERLSFRQLNKQTNKSRAITWDLRSWNSGCGCRKHGVGRRLCRRLRKDSHRPSLCPPLFSQRLLRCALVSILIHISPVVARN